MGEFLRAGDVILLLGDFGVGKTQLVRGIARGLGSSDLVTSPSFVLVNEYAGARELPIYHIDLYRIAAEAELETIGVSELWGGPGVCLIEWAERAGQSLPPEHLAVHFQYLSETKRVLRFVPHGDRYKRLLDAFKGAAFGD